MEFLRSRFSLVPPLPFLFLVVVLFSSSSCSTAHRKQLAERDAMQGLEEDNRHQDLLLLQKDALIDERKIAEKFLPFLRAFSTEFVVVATVNKPNSI